MVLIPCKCLWYIYALSNFLIIVGSIDPSHPCSLLAPIHGRTPPGVSCNKASGKATSAPTKSRRSHKISKNQPTQLSSLLIAINPHTALRLHSSYSFPTRSRPQVTFHASRTMRLRCAEKSVSLVRNAEARLCQKEGVSGAFACLEWAD
jgi:hypothetical protein